MRPPPCALPLLAHDLGKGTTPPDQWPKHIMHESRGLPLVDALCSRMRVPTAHAELARMACKQHTNVHRALELRPETVLKLLEECDALRRPERFSELLLACQCDAQGRTGLEDSVLIRSANISRLRGKQRQAQCLRPKRCRDWRDLRLRKPLVPGGCRRSPG